jgi:two-component system, sensor histidine kinase and response regulator
VAPSTPAARILVADDNAQILALIGSILRSEGFDVVTCERGARAVELAAEQPFDLILLDAMMPDMDGFDACEQIRRGPKTATVPIAFITGMTDESTFEDAVEAGADEVLSKPVSRGSLLLRVRSLLRLGRLREQRQSAWDLIRQQRDQLLASRREREDLTELLLADLEQPLNVIRARSGRLADGDPPPDEVRRAARDLVDAERSLQEVVRILLDVYQGAEGRFTAVAEDVELGDLFHAILAPRQQRAERGDVTLEPRLAAGLAGFPMALDGALLRRALGNLVDRSLFAVRPGGQVVLIAELLEHDLRIGVRDDGGALEPAELERLEDKGPGESTLTGRLPRSRGLGLVLCRLVAEAHGGDLHIDSDEEQTTVWLRLRPLPGGDPER